MLEVASALVEASKEENFKPSVESSHVLSIWLRKRKELTRLILLSLNEEEKALAEAVESLFYQGLQVSNEQLFALSPVIDAFFENTW